MDASMSTNIDNAILNLKIISQLKEYDKLICKKELLVIDKHSYLQCIDRWYNKENRDFTVKKIDDIVDQTFSIINKIMNIEKKNKNTNLEYIKTINNDEENYNKNNNSHLLQRLLIEITNARRGLNNLKITYNSDTLIKSRLDLIIDKLNIKIDEINQILKIKL